jgi:uncharacterized protein (DUF433 family)
MVEIVPGVVSDPEVLGGQPILKGHRIAVSQLLGQLAGGMTLAEIQDDYQLTDEEMQTILRYAAVVAREKDGIYVHQS